SVERAPPPRRFWSTTIAVDRPSIRSASGWPSLGRNPRTNAEKVSLSWRCASAAIASNTSDDLPDPDTPTNAVICRFGIRTDTSRRLFSRAPTIAMYSVMRSFLGRIADGNRPLSRPLDAEHRAAARQRLERLRRDRLHHAGVRHELRAIGEPFRPQPQHRPRVGRIQLDQAHPFGAFPDRQRRRPAASGSHVARPVRAGEAIEHVTLPLVLEDRQRRAARLAGAPPRHREHGQLLHPEPTRRNTRNSLFIGLSQRGGWTFLPEFLRAVIGSSPGSGGRTAARRPR